MSYETGGLRCYLLKVKAERAQQQQLLQAAFPALWKTEANKINQRLHTFLPVQPPDSLPREVQAAEVGSLYDTDTGTTNISV